MDKNKEVEAQLKAELEVSEAKDQQDAVDAMSTRSFLIGRTKETIQVPVSGLGGSKSIEIRARLSKSEIKQHQFILDKWKNAHESGAEFIESEEDEAELARFLGYITTDKELSSGFWLSDDIAPEIADDILMAYFIDEPLRRMLEMSRFLGQRLRTGTGADVAGVASDSDAIR